MKEIIIDEISYKIGTNADDNQQLVQSSDPNFYWFHLEKFPSAHVVVSVNELTNEIIFNASSLVKEFSKYKFKHIGVSYCKINNLVHDKEPGLVFFKSNRQVKRFNL